MIITVTFCTQNDEAGSDEVKERLEQDARVQVVEHECLNYCGDCYLQPFAMVNGEKITGNSAKELLEKIEATCDLIKTRR